MYSKLWAEAEAEKKPQARAPVAADRPVLPTMLLQTTKLMPFGMLTKPTRHFFSDGDGLWGEHNPHFGSQKQGDARW